MRGYGDVTGIYSFIVQPSLNIFVDPSLWVPLGKLVQHATPWRRVASAAAAIMDSSHAWTTGWTPGPSLD
jgi:hypothetical protein